MKYKIMIHPVIVIIAKGVEDFTMSLVNMALKA